MDADSYGLIFIFFICLLLSGFFSASETAFSVVNRIRLKNSAQEGSRKAACALRLTENYDSMISAVLIGNNIVNIAAASVATVLFVKAYGDMGATFSTLFTTLVILICGEITPKIIAKAAPEKFCMLFSGVIRSWIFILRPLLFLIAGWKNLIKKLFKLDSDTNITEGEFLTLVDEAENEGGIGREDSELIKSVIEFNDLDAGEIFTPRVDIVAVALDESPEEIEASFMEHEFSRMPVYKDDVDDIIGFIHQRDFYSQVLSGKAELSDIINKVLYVAPTMKISKVLTELQKNHIQMAVVTDEFGGTDGIITTEDILEELVGEIYDEHDEVTHDIVKLSENKYKVFCGADLEDMLEFFGRECESDSNSVGGWLLERFERIPDEGDELDFEGLHIRVTKTDSRRVLEIEVDTDGAEESQGGEK